MIYNYSDWVGEETEETHELICEQCGSEDIFDDTPDHIKYKTLYVCEDCGNYFEILN